MTKHYGAMVFLCLIHHVILAQNEVNITKDLDSWTFSQEEIFFLQDKTGKLSINEIIQEKYQKRFKIIPKNSPNFGYSTDAYWLKIRVKKNSNIPHVNSFLELAYPTLDTVQFYHQNKKGQWQQDNTGDRFPFSQRKIKHRHFVFSLLFRDANTHTFYIKINSKGSILAPLILYTHDALYKSQVKQETFYGFFYGILLIMACYNLFLFFSLRDKNYLLYVISILLNIFAQASLTGHTNQYLWGDSIIWANFSLIFFIYLGFSCFLLFSINFLKIKRYQKFLYYAMLFTMYINSSLAFLGFLLDYNISIRFMAIIVVFSSILMLSAGFASWIKGNQYARFFTLAWLVYLVGAITMALRNLGILPDFFWTRHGVEIGSLLEVLLISFALVDRINIYRKNTEKAQKLTLEKSQENEKLIQKQNEVLETKIQERTQDLNIANQELVAQEEELRQNMEELQAIQEALEDKSKALENQHRMVESSIKSAQTIQQAILPYEEKLNHLLKDYFVIYKPRDVVSGDFYWLNKIGHKTVLAVVDCTGHGVPGAFMSLIGNTLLDKIVRVWEITNPAEILSKLNEDIQIMLRQKETQNNSGMDMTIINWEYLDNEQVKLEFAGAKNSFFYVEPQSNGIKEVKGDRKSIGGQQKLFQIFTSHEFIFQPDTLIYLGSDGLEDQNNIKRKKFGRKKLQQVLLENSSSPLCEQQKTLEQNLHQHMENTQQRDDILWIGLKL